jgi:hypothetical protein
LNLRLGSIPPKVGCVSLTELLKALIKLEALPSGIVKKQMREMRDILAARNPSLDEPTNDFIEAARKLIDDLLEGSNLTPPPRFGIVQGGKTDKPD